MVRPIIIVAVCAVSLLAAALVARAVWIKGKIASLSEPASFAYAANNASLPPKGPKPRVVLIGDSRIAQWPAAPLVERWEIINRGIGGETAAQLAQRFKADAIALDPDLIVIQSGINDLVAASFMDEAEKLSVTRSTGETLVRLAEEAAANGRGALIAAIIPPAKPEVLRLPVWRGSLGGLVEGVNADLKKAQWPDGTSLVDLSTELLSADHRTLLDVYRRDTLHLNEAGYTRLNAALAERLKLVTSNPQAK